jgi:glucose/arabinose dehydrogenase
VKSRAAGLLILLVVLGFLLPAEAVAEFTDFPGAGNFEDEFVVGGVPAPTAIDWLPPENPEFPDIRVMLVATQGGNLYRWDGAGDAESILDLSEEVCSAGEMGLLGLAVDPAFSGNRFIYLYYTHKKGGNCEAANRANRVSRFTLDSNGDPGGETVLIDNIAAPGSNHNAGDLQFGRNGLLYISVGDGGSTPDTARRLNTLNGKILRIDRNGGIPADNPIQGPGTARCSSTGGTPSQLQDGTADDKSEKKRKKKRKAKKKRRGNHKGNHKKKNAKQKRRQQRRKNRQDQDSVQGPTTNCQEIYATGLRNPFRIAFNPNNTPGAQQFFINDVGGGAWEEIDVGAPGADYGWDVREGPCVRGSTTDCSQPSGFVEPIHAYKHQTGCRTITGGAFVPTGSSWPAAYWGDYLFADLACGTIFHRDAASGAVTEFATGAGAIHLKFGSDGALYYTTYEGGQVRRIIPIPPP